MIRRPAGGLAAAAVLAALAGALAEAQSGTGTGASAGTDHGRQVYDNWCAGCHADAPAMPGTSALRVKYNGSLPAVLLERNDLTPALISFYVRNGVSVMPPFRKTEITDDDLAALAAYIVESATE